MIILIILIFIITLIFRLQNIKNENLNSFLIGHFKSLSKNVNFILNQYENEKEKNNFRIISISYSNEIYQTQLKLNKKSAIEIGKVNKFYEYGPNDIDDEFKEKNKEILLRERGNGYWLWKPYFILKTLKENLNDGDYLIYTDAAILYRDNAKILVDFLINNNAEMWLYRLPYLEKNFTKRDAFVLLGADSPFYTETYQYGAAIQIYKKSIFTVKFLEELLYYSQDKRIITDDPNTQLLPNLEGFVDHRHDQSVLSILTKKYSQVNSGKTNIDIKKKNQTYNEMPFIFCHYRRINFTDYDDLKKKCNILN